MTIITSNTVKLDDIRELDSTGPDELFIEIDENNFILAYWKTTELIIYTKNNETIIEITNCSQQCMQTYYEIINLIHDLQYN